MEEAETVLTLVWDRAGGIRITFKTPDDDKWTGGELLEKLRLPLQEIDDHLRACKLID